MAEVELRPSIFGHAWFSPDIKSEVGICLVVSGVSIRLFYVGHRSLFRKYQVRMPPSDDFSRAMRKTTYPADYQYYDEGCICQNYDPALIDRPLHHGVGRSSKTSDGSDQDLTYAWWCSFRCWSTR